MTENNDRHLDVEILPADQRRAADMGLALLDEDGGRLGDLLAELLDAGAERALAVTAVLGRNLVSALVTTHGVDTARRMLESARWDATLAEPDAVED